ncbi:MAG TPA: heavy metal-binding domain-containing protein [Hyphomicrobium sp.]|nr:heavy metal-binding domain-containing protein [Hyphomicrobium sp.]
MLVVTTNEIQGYRVVRHLGLVRGLTVRSRSVVGNLGAAIQIFFGGNISVYTKLAEHARQEAFDLLVEHAQSMGANAVIAMRYDANEIAAAVTEVLAYGSAVVVEPVAGVAQPSTGGSAGAPGPWAGR